MLSATLEMLTDFGPNPDVADSSPFGFVSVGNLTYFSTSQGSPTPNTTKTWVTDGTTNGTRMLSEVLPGNLLVSGVAGEVAGKLYFTASYPDLTGYQLWQWGGLGSEPSPVLSATGQPLSISTPIVEVNGVWYFGALATPQSIGPELWRTDGTQGGTYQVKEIRPGPMGGFNPSNVGHQPMLFNVDGALMFVANDGTHGSELWTSDGTEAGTVMVKDVGEGSSSGVDPMPSRGRIAAVVGDLLYFSATDQSSGSELWRSDGTEAGTHQVKDVGPGVQGSEPQHLTNVGGTLYFNANDGVNGKQLWKSDGTEAGTALVHVIETSGSDPGPIDLTEMNGVLFFSSARYLWRSDGTAEGTFQLRTDEPVPRLIYLAAPVAGLNQTFANFDNLVNLNGTLYFSAQGGIETLLWRTDGSANGASLVVNPPSFGPSAFTRVESLRAAGGKLYFAGHSSHHGTEPWISDGTTAGTRLLKDVTGVDSSSGVGNLISVDDKLLFTAYTGESWTPYPRGWWTTDGDVPGTTNYAPLARNFNAFSIIGSAGGLIYFKFTSASEEDWDLWRTDGTAAGTFRVKDIRPGLASAFGDGFADAAEVNGILYFRANDGVHGSEIWRTDGTEAGTYLLADVNPGTANSAASGEKTLTNVGGTLYFSATDGVSFASVWKSDGTSEGTALVRTFDGVAPKNLVNVSGLLYFSAGHEASGNELWTSDGTENGTVLVKDIKPTGDGISRTSLPQFTNVAGTLYFIANDGASGYELWKSDGTEAGTLLVRDIRFAGGSSLVVHSSDNSFTAVGSTLYFYANDGVHGIELWKSDGTGAGTSLVEDIRLGSSASYTGPLTKPVNVGGILYFSANDGLNGVELWRSDGTETGATMVRNLNKSSSSASADPTLLTNVNGRLYFTANDGTHGTELWVLSPDPSAMAAGDYDQNGVTDGADFLKWQRKFGSSDVTNDGDGDGIVGGGDLAVWRESFGLPESESQQHGRAVVAAALLAEDEESADAALAAANASTAMGDGAEPSQLARDALFAAGDFSRLFSARDDNGMEGSWRRRGRLAPLARRG